MGHKHYPVESITEQLISDIGRWYGFKLADSKLCLIGGQIRFLSRYFIENKFEELYHGADLYAGFLNDKAFVEEVELQNQTQSFFTVKFTKEVIDYFFEHSHDTLFRCFMRMLFFDALVGNNDRHIYNWGVIRDVYGVKLARFSPIYDSARGLLWNDHEEKIRNILGDNKRRDAFIKRYCNNSKPKIGVEKEQFVNHFDLVECHRALYKGDKFIQEIFVSDKLSFVLDQIDKEYRTLLSKARRSLICDIITYRYQELKKIVS